MLKIGYKASAEQFAPRALLEFSVLTEESGFDSVMISDHFQPWRYTDGHSPFSLAWLAALGERTKRVQIGTSVVTRHSASTHRSSRTRSRRSAASSRSVSSSASAPASR